MRRVVAVAAVVAALVTGTTACAGDGPAYTSTAVHFEQSSGSSGSAGSRALRVGLTEWTIAVSARRVPAGRIMMRVTNTGATEHDLVVAGRAGEWRTPDLDPGEHALLIVVGRPGERLRLWCAEPGHEEQGMHTTVSVER